MTTTSTSARKNWPLDLGCTASTNERVAGCTITAWLALESSSPPQPCIGKRKKRGNTPSPSLSMATTPLPYPHFTAVVLPLPSPHPPHRALLCESDQAADVAWRWTPPWPACCTVKPFDGDGAAASNSTGGGAVHGDGVVPPS
jgi:hypothetical protein